MHSYKLVLAVFVACVSAGCGSSSSSSSSGSGTTGTSGTSGTTGTTGSCSQLGMACTADAQCCGTAVGSCAFGHCEPVSTTAGTSSGSSTGTSGTGDVVINEISAQPDAWMELHNRGTTPVNLNGWVWTMTGHNPSNPTFNATDHYTFGDVTIPADGYLVFHSGTGTDDATNVYRGSDISWGVDSASATTLPGSATLIDSTFHDADFVCWVTLPTGSTSTTDWSTTAAVPGFESDMSISRSSGADTNSPDDWTQGPKTEGAANQ